jgi:hypothetical protein
VRVESGSDVCWKVADIEAGIGTVQEMGFQQVDQQNDLLDVVNIGCSDPVGSKIETSAGVGSRITTVCRAR